LPFTVDFSACYPSFVTQPQPIGFVRVDGR
jgi:hypothetical protein